MGGQDESKGEYIRERKFPEKGAAKKISENEEVEQEH